ncbi:MAG TPA: hypothetical protein VJA66_00075 [Thermoanaerobaculia bacterium]
MSPTSGDPDREVTRLFEEKRRADEASAPDIRELLSRPRLHRARGSRATWRLGLAAAALIVVAASVVLLRSKAPRTPETELPTAAQIASWRAPTDVLLRTPGSDLLHQLPVLESQASEAASAVLEPTKGVER